MTPDSRLPVPLRRPTSRGRASRNLHRSLISCAMASLRASTLDSTLTMRSSLSRRATRSKLTGRRSQRSLTVKPARKSVSRTTSIRSERAMGFDGLDFYKIVSLPSPGGASVGRGGWPAAAGSCLVHVGGRDDGRLAVGGVREARPAVLGHALDAQVVADEGEALLVPAEVAVEGERADTLRLPGLAAVEAHAVGDVDQAVPGVVLL